ncbi:MAG: tyrosine-type recombinase/integrase [Methylocella sp.]
MSDELTESFVKKIQPPKTAAITVWDSKLTGFGVRVFAPTNRRPQGARSFFINYRIDGRERRFTIGTFPEWSAEAARNEAKKLRRRIDKGDDPASKKRERREAPTVADLAERYRTEHLPKKAESSQANDWAMIKNEILPRLGSRKVAEVHHGDIEALHREISKDRPVRANRVVAALSKMFSLSLKPMEGEDAAWRNHAQGNPCKGVERNPEEGHERFFSEAELAALSDALVAYGPKPAGDCIRFIMLTGCRPGEAMAATWEQFDAEPGFWVKPSSHTKQRKTQKGPLGPAALELLATIRASRESTPRRSGSDYVFPGQVYGQPLRHLHNAWKEITGMATVALWSGSSDHKIAGLVADLEKGLGRRPTLAECRSFAAARGVKPPPGLSDARIYDLRHTFASVGAGGGLSLQIIGRLLGHTQARTTMKYAHLADDPLREAAAKITRQIAGAGKNKADVVSLPKRGGVA